MRDEKDSWWRFDSLIRFGWPQGEARLVKRWTTKAGYEACVLDMAGSHLCGYVKLPLSHPLAGQDYYDLQEKYDFGVHGGLTWGDKRLPQRDEDDSWWYGFDCIHEGDKCFVNPSGKEWSQDMVMEECERLAEQFKELENG